MQGPRGKGHVVDKVPAVQWMSGSVGSSCTHAWGGCVGRYSGQRTVGAGAGASPVPRRPQKGHTQEAASMSSDGSMAICRLQHSRPSTCGPGTRRQTAQRRGCSAHASRRTAALQRSGATAAAFQASTRHCKRGRKAGAAGCPTMDSTSSISSSRPPRTAAHRRGVGRRGAGLRGGAGR